MIDKFSLYDKKLLIISGHYGTGKTNIAVNLALECAARGCVTSIVDLDIVNPYFRTADNAELLKQHGIRAILPEFANTNVDIPSLPREFYSVFDGDEKTVIDVGGDDDGAVVLAVHEDKIKAAGYKMLFVYNMYRPMIEAPRDAYEMLCNIERASHLKFDGIINNSNLGAETTRDIITASFESAEKLAELAALPVIFTAAEQSLKPVLNGFEKIKYISNITKKLY